MPSPLALRLFTGRFCFEFDFHLFVVRRGALPKLHHLRTLPKLHMLRTARAPHHSNQIAHDPNQRIWRTLNTYVFPRTLCLEIKSACNPNFLLFQAHKIILSMLLQKVGPQNDFVNIVAKSWKIKRNNRRQSKSDTICGGNRRKEASFEKKAESTEKMK